MRIYVCHPLPTLGTYLPTQGGPAFQMLIMDFVKCLCDVIVTVIYMVFSDG